MLEYLAWAAELAGGTSTFFNAIARLMEPLSISLSSTAAAAEYGFAFGAVRDCGEEGGLQRGVYGEARSRQRLGTRRRPRRGGEGDEKESESES